MRHPTYLVVAITAIIIMSLSVVALRRYLPYTGIDLSPRKPPTVVISMNNVRFVGFGHDGKQWSAKAKRVEIGQDRTLTKLAGVYDGKVFDKAKVILKVKAGKAAYRTYNKNLQLTGGVEVIGPQGQKITSTGADWNSSEQILRSNGQVNVLTGSSSVSSDGLRVDLKSKEMRMWNVQGRINMSDLPSGLQEGLKDAQ